jgi:CRP-like cAMP-binding protein
VNESLQISPAIYGRATGGSSLMASGSKPSAGSTGNLFLDSLPPESANRILPNLDLIEAKTGTIITPAGSDVESAIFPIGAVISVVCKLLDGREAEVSLVGREGVYGLPLALGNATSVSEAVVQIPNSMWRMTSTAFVDCMQEDRLFFKRVLSFVQVTIESIAQFSACNRLHPTNERCARWLLMAHDRVPGNEIFLTHEYLATMLGVRRPGVSIAAAALDEAGFIEYRRGRIVVKNRRGLESASCECYGIVNDSLDRLLGYDVRKRSAPTNGLVEALVGHANNHP